MNREEPAFKIKNANFPLFVLHVHTADLDKLKGELKSRFMQTPGFYSDSPMVIGLDGIADSGITPDFAELATFMRSFGVYTAGILGGNAAQQEAAVQAGMGPFPEAPSRSAVQTATVHNAPVQSPIQIQPDLPGLEFEATETEPEKTAEIIHPSDAGMPDTPQAETREIAAVHRPTMVIDKPVRTGQRIYAEGADLVVLAIVNAGAELIADGDIHVYAPLRGRAIAGAHGNSGARIFVQRLEAELISIAGCFQVFENGIPETVRGKPAQVHLDGSRLVFQALPV